MSLTAGKHQLRFGSDLRAPLRNIYLDIPAMRGEMSFNGQFTGNGFGDFLLGYVQGAQTSVFGEVDQRLWMWSGFVQDDWKVAPNLTLNLGLRYDFATWPYEGRNRAANLDLRTGQQVFAKDGSLESRTLVKTDENNFAPRIGIAWSVNDKTVIRTGYGRFYQLFERYGSEDQLALNPPFLLNAQESTTSRTAPIFFLRDGFPAKYRDAANIDLRRIRLRSVNPDAVMPEADQWNFGVQRLLPLEMVLTLDYIGTKGTHLSIIRNPNFLPGRPSANAQNRIFPNLGDVQLRENAANSIYNGLNATLEKRFSRGLSFRLAHTWSKAIDVAGQPLNSGGSASVQDPLNFLALRGLSDYDYRHRFVTAFVYELPFGKGRSSFNDGVAAWVLGGWRVSGIFTHRTGRPFSVTAGENGGFVGSSAAPQANRIADGRLDDRSIDHWFDIDAFVAPKTTDGLATFGNAGRGILIGPTLTNFDFSIARNFNFTERARMEFRWETFNLANTPQFGLPASNISSRGNAGRITTLAGDPRVMQFALKLVF